MSDRSLTPELLLGAYAAGVFPMAESQNDPEVHWVDPRQRGVLPLDGFRMSRSLARRMRSFRYGATLDVDFMGNLEGVADRDENWINVTISVMMVALLGMGFAHAFGVWHEDRLVGGMYGLALGGAFFGESMFSRETDGSKMALAWSVDHLRQTGFTLFDTQFITPHLASLGAVEIPREHYHALLAQALSHDVSFDTKSPVPTAQDVIQRNAQTS